MRSIHLARFAALLFAAGTLFASGLTGRWHGTIAYPNHADPDPEDFEFRQKGDRLIGVRINSGGVAQQVLNGRIANGRVTFEVYGSGIYDLSLNGDVMSGRARGGDDPGSWGPCAVKIVREASLQPGPLTGVWVGTMGAVSAPGAAHRLGIVMILRQNGNAVWGSMGGEGPFSEPLSEGQVRGNKVIFASAGKANSLELTLEGDELTGVIPGVYGQEGLKISVKKIPATRRPGETWVGLADRGLSDDITIEFDRQGDKICGNLVFWGRDRYPMSHGIAHGDKIAFDVTIARRAARFELTVGGDELSGSAKVTGGEDGPETWKITATKRFE